MDAQTDSSSYQIKLLGIVFFLPPEIQLKYPTYVNWYNNIIFQIFSFVYNW